MSRIIVALDVPGADDALALVDRLGDAGDFYKVGLELYTRAGPAVVRELVGRGKRVFLDLKLHDIPNTVAAAVTAASDLGVDLLTLHASGGPKMLEAATLARGADLRLLAVTLLTSLSPDEISTTWGREIRSVREEVGRLALLAHEAEVDGVVASALEASWIRNQVEEDFLIVTPGIRPVGSARGDQNRVATPTAAVEAGADYMVVGRPVIQAEDSSAALDAILKEIAEAVAGLDS
jgi:orotidine-5'-phosphate decarboxylase